MRKRRIGKKRLMVTAVPVLTAGAVASVAAYQAGVGFKPKASDRNLQVNQVVFSDNKDTAGKDQQKNNDIQNAEHYALNVYKKPLLIPL